LKLKRKKQRGSIYTFWCMREKKREKRIVTKKREKRIVTNNKPEDDKVTVPKTQQNNKFFQHEVSHVSLEP